MSSSRRKILYVGDVIPGTVVRWRKVFVADVTPADQRPQAAQQFADAPRITVAAETIATADVAHNRIQLSLVNSSNYDVEKDIEQVLDQFLPQGRSR